MKQTQLISETTGLNNKPNAIWDTEALSHADIDGIYEQSGTYPILDYTNRHIAIIFKDSTSHTATVIRVGGTPLQFIDNADDEVAISACSLS
ncbi:MAG: hypothetical protein ACXWE9_11655 [Methylobacter sp.]